MTFHLSQQSPNWGLLHAGKGFPGANRMFQPVGEPPYVAAHLDAAPPPGTNASYTPACYALGFLGRAAGCSMVSGCAAIKKAGRLPHGTECCVHTGDRVHGASDLACKPCFGYCWFKQQNELYATWYHWWLWQDILVEIISFCVLTEVINPYLISTVLASRWEHAWFYNQKYSLAIEK